MAVGTVATAVYISQNPSSFGLAQYQIDDFFEDMRYRFGVIGNNIGDFFGSMSNMFSSSNSISSSYPILSDSYYYDFIGGDILGNYWMLAEHVKNPTPSNLPIHQKGQARKRRDAFGEKGDARRRNNDKAKNRRKKFSSWIWDWLNLFY